LWICFAFYADILRKILPEKGYRKAGLETVLHELQFARIVAAAPGRTLGTFAGKG